MFGKKLTAELSPPPIATHNPKAFEVLRVWAADGQPQQLTLKTTWKDSAAWGLLLVDVARHAAKAYAKEGYDAQEVLARIRLFLEKEFANPTDTPVELS